MNDLISRSALLEKAEGGTVCWFDIKHAPAVDAVEVVRCIDCRYLKTCNRTIELIPRQAQIGYLRCVVHYCEYGERRADNAID
jgi:hypothetical protein